MYAILVVEIVKTHASIQMYLNPSLMRQLKSLKEGRKGEIDSSLKNLSSKNSLARLVLKSILKVV